MGPQGSSSFPAETQPMGAAPRGRPDGPERISLWARGGGGQPAAPLGLSLWARGQVLDRPARRDSVSRSGAVGVVQPALRNSATRRWTQGSTSTSSVTPSGLGDSGVHQQPRKDSAFGQGAGTSTIRQGGTQYGDAGPRGWSSVPGGTASGRGPAGFDQPARRDSASRRGAPPAGRAGLSLRTQVAGVDQPARRDSSSERGPPRSTRRPVGTEPPSTVLHKPARRD